MDIVTALRRFNRSYTQRIGALEESFLGTGRPLAQSRLLYEIGLDGAGVLDLRRTLGLDSGYLSRLLAALESEGLVSVEPDPEDRRRRVVRPTSAGIDAWSQLDDRSNDLARTIVEPLSESQRHRLGAALLEADRLLRAATIRVETLDPMARDARDCVEQYFAELTERFPHGFDAEGVAAADAPDFVPPRGAFLVAYADTEPVACGGIKRIDDHTAEIKRMWVAPSWRGLGLGVRMLGTLEEAIVDMGFTRCVLDTNASLTEAITMYRRCGYTETDRYNDNPDASLWFEKDLGS